MFQSILAKILMLRNEAVAVGRTIKRHVMKHYNDVVRRDMYI